MNRGYTSLSNKIRGGIKLSSGSYYIKNIDSMRAKLDKDCKAFKLQEIMNKINLDSPMVVFRNDDLSDDRVIN